MATPVSAVLDGVQVSAKDIEIEDGQQVCLPEHCFHAWDALYCALTHRDSITPAFLDEKLCAAMS